MAQFGFKSEYAANLVEIARDYDLNHSNKYYLVSQRASFGGMLIINYQ